ncbi:MAG: pilus (MSHA type) biogenesis protein MshL [Betaproteobacteria bacterium]|nr:pilus (MSHA type) biogenesis protein MshL [Betaproteobacteria bacterium]
MLPRTLSATLTALLLAACATPTLKEPSVGHLRAESVAATPGTIPPPVQQAVSLPKPKPAAKTETYSVVVNRVKVHDLLFALARDAKLNVDIHPGIIGEVTLNALDQTLPQLLGRIAKQVDMRFELDGSNLAVMPDTPYLKTYRVDYVNMSRDMSGTVSTNTQIATTAVSAAGAAAGAGNTSRIKIENTSKNHFWESLEKNIKDILQDTDKERVISRRSAEASEAISRTNQVNASATGSGLVGAAVNALGAAVAGQGNQSAESKGAASAQGQQQKDLKEYEIIYAASVIANAETGVVSVRATSRQHEKVQEFIDRVMSSARRQVLIEATIVEVELSDGYQQGIEWSRLRGDGSGFSISKPTLGSNVTNSVTPFIFKFVDNRNPLNLLAAVNLLQSFGNLKVLSSPKLSVLNNQTATLKVSEEYVYFSVTGQIAAGTNNTSPVTTVTTKPESVSVGFFMSVTPQISEGDTVTLNVRPSISSISDLKQDPNPHIPTGIQNLVPQIRTREIESMLRIESGDIAVLGGLMEDRQDNKAGRVPLLGSIPLFGELLNNRANTSKKSELVIFLRPTVIKDASDFGKVVGSLPGKEFFAPDKVFQPFSPVAEPFSGSGR